MTASTAALRKKLIEVSIPLEAINIASAREKSMRHGHPSTLHLWWARRPLAACRAVLFSQLVDDPSSWPERFPTDEQQDIERKRLHKVIERMMPWESSNDPEILKAVRFEIARTVAWGLDEQPPDPNDGEAILDYLQTKAPPVYDPFSGGGSIPLEAQRLGLRAYGSDLNPVAVLIGKSLVEIPSKFVGIPPIHPEANPNALSGAVRNWNGAQGLAEDVRHYGEWMRIKAYERIGEYYPSAILNNGKDATVIAWLWARTIRSPDPAAKGAMVPLVSSFVLSTKEGKKVWVEPIIDSASKDGYRFEVKSGLLQKLEEERLKKGTKGEGRGSTFSCLLTGATIRGDYIKVEGMAGRLGERLMAVVAEGQRQRDYLSPTSNHEHIAIAMNFVEKVTEARESALSQPVPERLTGGTCFSYGLTTFTKLFTSRQLLALVTFSDLVTEARTKILSDAYENGFNTDTTPLDKGGTGVVAYADAVATYLAFNVTSVANSLSQICTWDAGGPGWGTKVRNTFSRQALPMTWDFAETSPFSGNSGSFDVNLEYIVKSLANLGVSKGVGSITNLDAATNNYPIRPIVISTDPPYYDNIGYADLSDFFYVWLKRSLNGVWPELFRRLTTPKGEELVATSYRHGGKENAETFFMHGMSQAIKAMEKATTDNEPLTIYYAFKQSELAEEGIISAGWASFLQAIVDAGLAIDGTWPVRTELANRMIAKNTNALASSIVLVCRKRGKTAPVVPRAEFIRILKREMPNAIDKIRKAGVGPVDMMQSVIGPGMGVFTRFERVLEDDDSAMGVRTALALINRVWGEIENDLDVIFDSETQVALAWFATYGFDARSSGDLITLANAKNIPSGALFKSGIFEDMHGRTRITPRGDLPRDWSPITDKNLTIWECVQHTARVLNADYGGAEAAAKLVASMGHNAENARALAYRLYQIASDKSWAAEALVYNELAQEWSNLEDLAGKFGSLGQQTVPMLDLFGETVR